MDIYSAPWNENDDNNSTASPDGAPEGMPASGVNNTMRAMMGATKRLLNQLIPKATDATGTSTQFTLTYSVAPTALADAMIFCVSFDKQCGNAPSLNVNLLGAKPLYKWVSGSWVALAAGDLLAGQIVRLTYSQTSGNFRVLDPLNVIPTGATIGFRGLLSQVPAGWLPEIGNSIGDASSGATQLASSACQALFTLLWSATNYQLQDSLGNNIAHGASAAADWAAHCRIVLSNAAGVYRRGDIASGGAVGGSGNLGSGTTSGSLTVSTSVSVSGTTSPYNRGGGFAYGSDFSVVQAGSVGVSASGTGSGSTSGSLSVSGTVAPSYVTELALIKL